MIYVMEIPKGCEGGIPNKRRTVGYSLQQSNFMNITYLSLYNRLQTCPA